MHARGVATIGLARCDPQADRERKALMVRSAYLEEGHSAARAARALSEDLREMRQWLGMERIEAARRGNLAAQLRRVLR